MSAKDILYSGDLGRITKTQISLPGVQGHPKHFARAEAFHSSSIHRAYISIALASMVVLPAVVFFRVIGTKQPSDEKEGYVVMTFLAAALLFWLVDSFIVRPLQIRLGVKGDLALSIRGSGQSGENTREKVEVTVSSFTPSVAVEQVLRGAAEGKVIIREVPAKDMYQISDAIRRLQPD